MKKLLCLILLLGAVILPCFGDPDSDAYMQSLLEKANAGDLESQYHYGFLHTKGRDNGMVGLDVKKDFVVAQKWLKIAAEKGHANAQCDLGFLLSTGAEGVSQDVPQALDWWKKAAFQGIERAIPAIAWEYRKDRIGKPDLVESLAWFYVGLQLCSKSPNLFDEKNVYEQCCEKFSSGLSEQDINTAKKRANELFIQVKPQENK